MGRDGFWGHLWPGIFLSASLLTTWSPPATAQTTPHGVLLTTSQSEREPLSKPTLSVSQDTVIEKGTVSLHCDTADINVTVHWFYNNESVELNERIQLSADGKNLTILTVQREDSGTYHCEVRGSLGVQKSNVTSLVVNYGPDPVEIKVEPGERRGDVFEVVEGLTVTLQVETQSHPTPQYTWYLPTDSTPRPTNRTYTIHTMAKEHEGMYTCLVSSSVTQLSHIGAVQIRIAAPQSSSLSGGAIAGIVIAAVVFIILVTGLGCFLYRRCGGCTRRQSSDDPIAEGTEHTCVNEHLSESPDARVCVSITTVEQKTMYDNIFPEPQGQSRGIKVLPSTPSQNHYEKVLPSAATVNCSSSPRKPLPKIPKSALTPPVPQRNTESSYGAGVYCQITPSA